MMFDTLKQRARPGSAQKRGEGRFSKWPILIAAILLWAFMPAQGRAENFSPAPPSERQTPSGLPVPRYVSLKYDTTNARAGPGDDTRLLFVFRVKGLPVQVVAETREWRRICDPDGGLSWVHKRLTDGRRTVLRLRPEALAMHKHPSADAQMVAYLKPRALAGLERCDKGWCEIEVDKVKGWVPSNAVWGAKPQALCRAVR
jgi:SH3-like domain-containing protein